jgi:hypothetical protein
MYQLITIEDVTGTGGANPGEGGTMTREFITPAWNSSTDSPYTKENDHHDHH